MFLLVVDEAAAVWPGPGALVALVRVLASVPPPVVDQVVRALELFATKVASMPELSLVHKLDLGEVIEVRLYTDGTGGGSSDTT